MSKILPIAVIAIIVVAGAAVALTYESDDSDGDISIVDGAGKKIVLDEALTNVAVINSNIPKAMVMLGIEDKISCYHYSKNLDIAVEKDSSNKLGTYYTPSVETLLDKGVQAVLCPVSSMTPYASTQKACEDNGIKVIRLDCNGESLFDDLEKLSTIFGNPESATKVLNDYNTDYQAVVDAIKAAVSDKEKLDYLASVQMTSGGVTGSLYNKNSAIAKLYDGIFGINVTTKTDLSTKTVLNTVNDGCVEAISEVMEDIDTFIMRYNLAEGKDTGADSLYQSYVSNGSGTLITYDSPAYKNDRIFVIETNLMSGVYGHIGLLIAAELAYGITVEGYEDISKVIDDFQQKYNQSLIEDGALLALTYGANHGTDNNGVLTYTEPAKA